MTEPVERTEPIVIRERVPDPEASGGGIVWTPRLVIWTLVLVLALIFALLNLDDTKVNLLFEEYTPPLALVAVIVFLVGYFLGWLRPHFRSRRRA